MGGKQDGRGTLAKWNERREVLKGQLDALNNELAQLDAVGRADLGSGLVAHIDGTGSLRINAGALMPPHETLALRDHLCDVLGWPECFQDVADVTTLTKQQALELATTLQRRALGNSGRHDSVAIDVRAAIFNALDHVGVIRSEPPTTRAPGDPAIQQGAPEEPPVAKPALRSTAGRVTGTAGSAQNEPLVRLGPGGDFSRDYTPVNTHA